MKKHLFRLAIFLLILFGIDWSVSGFLRMGMERYYGIGQNADILIIGHSHMMKTCNKDSLEKGLNMKIAKYCREGVLVQQRHAMVQHYLSKENGHAAPYVLYGVDPLMFRDVSALSHNLHKIFY
ncbi:MAG: SGNH/GDSL hydrolase family protein, partial [bacterium]|nr:SGNH/GDSL hydrolase family protein [bacterium]